MCRSVGASPGAASASALLLLAVLSCGTSTDADPGGGPRASGGPPTPGQAGSPGSALGTTGLENGGLGTDWHPDPDGDGVPTGTDRCPYIYDPAQTGEACDPKANASRAGGPIDDLAAEHVTPYGAWLTFRSNEMPTDGFRAEIAWSTKQAELRTAAGFDAAKARGDTVDVRVNERVGDRIPVPAIVTSLEPDTTYFFGVRDNAARVGKLLQIKTQAAPPVAGIAGHPRVMATPAFLDELKARNTSGDAAFATWKGQLSPRFVRALNDSDYEQVKYCMAAAVLARVTGDRITLNQAKRLHGNMIDHWKGNDFSGNDYRWADSGLALCTDLLWDDLDAATREEALSLFLAVDEEKISSANTDYRLDDTDECHASIRTWLIDGLVVCKADGVPAALSERACKILDRGLRQFFGVMAPSARRDRGWLALSGGHMADSSTYQPGSSLYWLQSLWALHNAGYSAKEFAPWVAHNLAANYLHETTPRRKGLVTFGDIDTYEVNFPNEPNSAAISLFHMDLIAMQMGLLRAAGRTREAGWARFYMNQNAPPDNYENRVAMLMFDTAAQPEEDYRKVLPTTYFDSGMGMFADRTSWEETASMLTARAGWSGVDHSQEENGHFQLYRRGRWITHEPLAYDGAAAQAPGHNVVQLEMLYNHDVRRAGQFTFRNNGSARFVRTSAGSLHAYTHADLTALHQSGFTHYFPYDAVQRALLWLKPEGAAGADSLVVYDLIDDNMAERPSTPRLWQMHFDEAPNVDGRHATLELEGGTGKQKVDLTVLLPQSADLRVEAPEGEPGAEDDKIYTHRLVADPKSTDPRLRIVSVLQAADAGGAAAPPVAPIESEGYVGATVGGAVVLFPRAPLAASEPVAARVTVPVAAGARVFWAGHVAAAGYTVSAQVGGGKMTLQAAPGGGMKADRGGLLILDVARDGAVSPAYR